MSKETQELFSKELEVINVGVEHFADAMRAQGVKVEQVEWKPPAGGQKPLVDLLTRLGGL